MITEEDLKGTIDYSANTASLTVQIVKKDHIVWFGMGSYTEVIEAIKALHFYKTRY